jgi:ABC-type multidrug transport system fused ATPase/permease subunit
VRGGRGAYDASVLDSSVGWTLGGADADRSSVVGPKGLRHSGTISSGRSSSDTWPFSGTAVACLGPVSPSRSDRLMDSDSSPAPALVPATPTKWIRSRFQIQSASLWRLMRLLRPYRTQIIMANLLAALSTSMAGFCLLALHPLFQVAMTPQDGQRSPTEFIGENFQIPMAPGSTNAPAAREALNAPPEPPQEGLVAGKFRSLRQLAERSESLGPTVTVWIDRAEAQWGRFSAWASASPARLITLYIAFIVFLYLLSQLFIFASDYVMGQMSLNVTMGIMREVYGNVLNQEFNYFSSNTTGALLNICYRQVMQLRGIIRFLVSTRFMIPINMLIMYGVLMAISFKLAILLLAFLPLVILPALALVAG